MADSLPFSARRFQDVRARRRCSRRSARTSVTPPRTPVRAPTAPCPTGRSSRVGRLPLGEQEVGACRCFRGGHVAGQDGGRVADYLVDVASVVVEEPVVVDSPVLLVGERVVPVGGDDRGSSGAWSEEPLDEGDFPGREVVDAVLARVARYESEGPREQHERRHPRAVPQRGGRRRWQAAASGHGGRRASARLPRCGVGGQCVGPWARAAAAKKAAPGSVNIRTPEDHLAAVAARHEHRRRRGRRPAAAAAPGAAAPVGAVHPPARAGHGTRKQPGRPGGRHRSGAGGGGPCPVSTLGADVADGANRVRHGGVTGRAARP